MTTITLDPPRQGATPGAGAVPTAKSRVTPAQSVANSMTMAYRGILKIKHNPEQLGDVTLQPILFTLIFTYIFGGAISGNVHAYLPTIIPGILVQTVITTSSVTGAQLREDMNKGVFDRFKSLPIARISPLAGALIADMVRYFIATALTIVMGLILGYRPGGGVAGTLMAGVIVVVCSFAISWIFALMGVLLRSSSSVQGVSILILFPLTFMSGAFAPVSTMPHWMQDFIKVNPVNYLVSASRELMNSNHYGSRLAWSLIGSAIVVAVFAPLTVRLYMRKA